jgi:repressor LexA
MQGDGKLTRRQQQVLAFFNETVLVEGAPPTIRQVMRKCGLKSPRGAEIQLRALTKCGYLVHQSHQRPAYRPRNAGRGSQVPILGRAPAGHPSDQPEEPEGFLPLPWTVGKNAFAIRVVGESMRDAHILSGDFVVVDPNAESRDGDVVVATIDGQQTIKRLKTKGRRWWLEPSNAEFPPAFEPRVEGDHVLGRVVAVVRRLQAS